MTRDKAVDRALDRLRQPGAELVLTADRGAVTGRAYFIMPGGIRVGDAVAQRLLEDPRIQPYSPGLLPGHWQSWRLGRKR